MSDDHAYRFQAELWMYTGKAAWYFVTLPHEVADEIEERTAATTRGFGSVRVEVTVGSTTWQTSVFPDSKSESYALPMKRAVREAEGLVDGRVVDLTLRLNEDD